MYVYMYGHRHYLLGATLEPAGRWRRKAQVRNVDLPAFL